MATPRTQAPDIEQIRSRAREHVGRGPVTEDYDLDPDAVVDMLQDVLSTELVCQLRYRDHHHAAADLGADVAAAEFLEHAEQEGDHASWAAARIGQLGGRPDFDPGRAARRSHVPYRRGETVAEMIHENLVAERIACATYREMTRVLGQHDPTTRRLIERILEQEETHASDMVSLRRRAAPPVEAEPVAAPRRRDEPPGGRLPLET